MAISSKRRASKVSCPNCGHWDSLVYDGFEDDFGRGYSRRRRCSGCGKNYFTIEIVDDRKVAGRSPVVGPLPAEK